MIESFLMIVVLILYLRLRTICGHFAYYHYKDKRKKNVTLHMKTSKVPTKKKDVIKLLTALRSSIRELKLMGYESVSFTSHLLNEERVNDLRSYLRNDDVTIIDEGYVKTPLWQKVCTIFPMLFKLKIVSIGKYSGTLKIVFNK
ncbi:hypothetical protein DVQ85_13570 [Yersinia enterocolitica]|nr:hypothetical protein [Yersinia enterocolitica]EKN5989316.1 hypothetical protein [Yersinia enterocolitica]